MEVCLLIHTMPHQHAFLQVLCLATICLCYHASPPILPINACMQSYKQHCASPELNALPALCNHAFSLCYCNKCHLMQRTWCAALPTPEQLDQTELRFLEDFCNLMVTAHYRLLTEQEWQTATDEECTVSSDPTCLQLHR